MSPRKRRKKKKPRTSSPPPPVSSPLGAERTLRDLNKLLESQDFENIDEINAYLAQLTETGAIPHYEPQTAQERAQELVFDAWEVGGQEAVQLAQKALKLDPNCADAYVLLAEMGPWDIIEIRNLYRKGVEAGERTLGEDFFEENEGDFWLITETRPYMRARMGLAEMQWALGHRDEAISHAHALLRLNPNDNQGVRYILAHWLFQERRFEELEALLREFEDDAGPDMGYTRALYTFYREGDTPRSRKWLKEAMTWNKHVPDFLLLRRMPQQFPDDYITVGGEDEAVSYLLMGRIDWGMIPGALEWLAQRTKR